MEEKTFFEHDGVKVSSARFVVDGQTFAMSNITSVNPVTQVPNRVGGIFFLLLGLATISQNAFFGIPLVAISIFYLSKQKTMFHIMLRTSGGETKALTTYQKEYLDQVVSALNEAIVYRG